ATPARPRVSRRHRADADHHRRHRTAVPAEPSLRLLPVRSATMTTATLTSRPAPTRPTPVRTRALPRPATVGRIVVLLVAAALTLGPVLWTLWISLTPK